MGYFEASNNIFLGGELCHLSVPPPRFILHSKTFPTTVQKLCLSKVGLSCLTTIIREDATSNLITHGREASHMGMIKKTLEGLSCNSCWGLDGSNLSPSWLSGCVITRPLGGKGVQFYSSAFYSVVENSSSKWIQRGKKIVFCSIPQATSLTFVFAWFPFRERESIAT